MPKIIAPISSIYYNLRAIAKKIQLGAASTEKVFTDIYHGNKWIGKQSVSGTGSDVDQTAALIEELPMLFREYNIKSMLDIPCGDFQWMKNVDLNNIEYLGGDIVKDVISENKINFQNDKVRFQHLNLLSDDLPAVDVILCRDCLVHFSFDDIFKALENIAASGCTYLAATTFPERSGNHNITTGDWRPINLEIAPFHFPTPLRLLNEQNTENNSIYKDKSLGLWRVEALPANY